MFRVYKGTNNTLGEIYFGITQPGSTAATVRVERKHWPTGTAVSILPAARCPLLRSAACECDSQPQLQ